MEDDRLVAGLLERVPDPHHRGGRVAEHGDADAPTGQVLERTPGVPGHAGDGRRRIVEDRPRDRVEPQDVDDGVHDEHVALAHEGAEGATARGARRHDHLRDADRERVHRRRAKQGAFRASQAEGAVEAALEPEAEADRTHALLHELDRRAPAARRLDPCQLVAGLARHLLPRDVGRSAGLAQDAGVDHDRPDAEARQPLAHVGDLGALRVERADERDMRLGFHRHPITPDRATPACVPRPAPSGTPRARPRGARRRARRSSRPSPPSP